MEKKTEHNKADFWVKIKMQLIKIIVHTGNKVETIILYLFLNYSQNKSNYHTMNLKLQSLVKSKHFIIIHINN